MKFDIKKTPPLLRPLIGAVCIFSVCLILKTNDDEKGFQPNMAGLDRSAMQSADSYLSELFYTNDGVGGVTVHIATTGDDVTGTGERSNPLRSPHRARELVRQFRQTGEGRSQCEVVIQFGPGVFYLPPGEPLELEPEDSYTVWRGTPPSEGETVISGGLLLNDTCWERIGDKVLSCSIPPERLAGKPRVARWGHETCIPARSPNFKRSEPYTGGWLFVDSVVTLGKEHTVFSVKREGLPAFAASDSWGGGSMYVYPKDSWQSYQAKVSRATIPSSDGLVWLNMTCPYPGACSDEADDEVSTNSRFFIFDTMEALSTGEWFWNETTNTMYVMVDEDGEPPTEFVVPTMEYVIWVKASNLEHGVPASPSDFVRNVTLEHLRFADNSYRRLGFQTGFSQRPEYIGFPDDGAVRISGGIGVAIRSCRFKALGGGGIVASNGTRGLLVEDSLFDHLGQSGIMLTGNATTETQDAVIQHNVILNAGLVHGSAGGIVLSSASRVAIRWNNISKIARWGIHIRDLNKGTGGGPSLNNIIEYNRLHDLGELTSALGGISVISEYGHTQLTNSTIAYNCIRNVIGEGNPVERPEYTYGIFLDNEASGYDVHHNVVKNSQYASIKVHYGHSNSIWNNVFYNASSSDSGTGQIAAVGDSSLNTTNNTFNRNVVVMFNKSTTKLLEGEVYSPYFSSFDYNLYFNPQHDIMTWDYEVTPLGNWSSWVKGGYDTHSLVFDPGFEDASRGNMCLDARSPHLEAIGFEEIPRYICEC